MTKSANFLAGSCVLLIGSFFESSDEKHHPESVALELSYRFGNRFGRGSLGDFVGYGHVVILQYSIGPMGLGLVGHLRRGEGLPLPTQRVRSLVEIVSASMGCVEGGILSSRSINCDGGLYTIRLRFARSNNHTGACKR